MVTASNYSLSKAIKNVAQSISSGHLFAISAILSFAGFLDATYLTILHYKNAIPPCTIGGCETVLTSKYASIGGTPIALVGAIYYLAILILILLIWQTAQKKLLAKLLFVMASLGLFAAIILVGIQAFVLHQYCLYCLTSELIDFLLFDCLYWLWRKTS